MKRTEVQSIGDVLRLTVQECNMTSRLNELKAIELWKPIVGAHIASRCGRPSVKNGLMTIPVNAGALRHELTMNRSAIVRLINNQLGKEVIHDIRFTG